MWILRQIVLVTGESAGNCVVREVRALREPHPEGSIYRASRDVNTSWLHSGGSRTLHFSVCVILFKVRIQSLTMIGKSVCIFQYVTFSLCKFKETKGIETYWSICAEISTPLCLFYKNIPCVLLNIGRVVLVSNETNTDVRMYIEEFILIEIWIHCCTKLKWFGMEITVVYKQIQQ